MQIWKSSNIFVFIKICWRFHIKTSFTFWDILPRDLWKVCLQIFRNKRICKKLAYFLRSLQASLANNSRIHRINNAHFSRYCFYMNTNIWGTFQIYISVPLKSLWHVGTLSDFLRNAIESIFICTGILLDNSKAFVIF